MGKCTRKNKRKSKPKEPEILESPTRRWFLRAAVAAVPVAAAVAGGFQLYKKNQAKWNFIHDLPNLDLNEAELNKQKVLVAGEESNMELYNKSERFRKAAEAKMEQIATKLGVNRDKLYLDDVLVQRLVIPAPERYHEPMLDYCKTAANFLYQKVSGLKDLGVRWTVPRQGENYSFGWERRGFVGDIHGSIGTLVARVKSAPWLRAKERTFLGNAGGCADFPGAGPTLTNIKNWWLFVGRGTAALQAPFSEMIPLLMEDIDSGNFKSIPLRENGEYTGGYNGSLACAIDEASSEAMSYFLALELSEKLGIPGGKEIIKRTAANLPKLGDRYMILPNAIRYADKHGVQATWDLRKEGRGPFFAGIING